MPLTIAVSGSGGVIGAGVIAAALKDGHRVVAIDRSATSIPSDVAEHSDRYESRIADLTDYESFKDALEGCDAIVHLAAVYDLKNPEDPDGPWLRRVPAHVGCRWKC